VYHVETWKMTFEASRHRRQARDRFLDRRRAKAEAAAGQQQGAGLPTTKQQALLPLPFLGANPAPPPASSSSGESGHRRVHFAADGSPEAAAAAAVADVDGGGVGSSSGGAGGSAAAGGSRGLSRMESLRIDAEYDAWVVYVIDRCCLCALFFSYNLAVLLIYVLQSGYVDLFG
jgi:hypothetical protein